jgi:phosphate transport system substrate-binding protein
MKNRFRTSAILTLLVIGLVFAGIGCTGNESGEKGASTETDLGNNSAVEEQDIFIKGSDTVLPLAQAEAEEFMSEYSEKSVTVTGGGSGVGIAALIDGEVDIASASRTMKDSEIESAEANGINPVEHVIAYDGISVVVNPENPISELSFEQLRGIYNGTISNWEDVGGEDKPIAILSRDSSSGTYEYFKEEVLLGDEYRPDALTQPTTGAIVTEVSQNPNAIGYIGVAYLDDSVKAVSLNAGDGSKYPSSENIISGEYPLARPLFFYTNGEPVGLIKEFIDFVQSEEGQNIVLEVGYFKAN